MRFSLRLNNDLPVRDYVALARAAEAAGFDQFWVSHDLFLRSSAVILTAVAGATERIGIGTCILNPYTIHPAEIAMFAATLDEWSGGRFTARPRRGRGRVPEVGRSAPDRAARHDPPRRRRHPRHAVRASAAATRPGPEDAYLRFSRPAAVASRSTSAR